MTKCSSRSRERRLARIGVPMASTDILSPFDDNSPAAKRLALRSSF
jgi:hypothetical protein